MALIEGFHHSSVGVSGTSGVPFRDFQREANQTEPRSKTARMTKPRN